MRCTLGPSAHGVLDWLNSKSMSVVPLGSETRLHARFKNPGMSAAPCLPVDVEAQQVALVGRDRVSRLAGADGVLLHAACVGVVAGSVHRISGPDFVDTCPVSGRGLGRRL